MRLAILAVCLAAACGCLDEDRAAARRVAPWSEFKFHHVEAGRGRLFNILLTAPAITKDDAEVRVLFELQPDNENYYYAALARDGLVLGKVECGVELPLAEWRGTGASPAFATEQQVTIVRRPGQMAVAVGNRKVLAVQDDTLPQGRVAVGSRGLSAPRVRVQPASVIYASDDFMRGKDDATAWRPLSGEWTIDSVTHPGRSANAFFYTGRPAGNEAALAVFGEGWWDDYTFEAAVRPAGRTDVGLVFRYLDPRNHYAFRQTSGSGGTVLRLVRREAGKEAVLAQAAGALRPTQWARLRISAFGPRLTATIDGHEVLRADDPTFAFGAIGLLASGGRGADFDDVFIRAQRGAVADSIGGAVAWQARGGEWTADDAPGSGGLRAVGPPGSSGLQFAKLLAGDDGWTDYRVAATVVPETGGRAGIITRYQSESQHDLFLYDAAAGEYQLVLVRDGEPKVVADTVAAGGVGPRSLAVRLDGGVTRCEVDGRQVLTHYDGNAPAGKAGACVGRESSATFGDLAVGFPERPAPVLTKLDTFAAETTMTNWAAAESDWRPIRTTCWIDTAKVNWHRGSFPGGGSIRIAAAFDPTRGGMLRLFTCCDVTPGRGSAQVTAGYEAVVQSLGRSGDGSVRLLRNGKEVGSAQVEAFKPASRVALTKLADHILVEIGGAAVLAFKDPEPLEGWSTGYVAQGVEVKPEGVDVFCDNVIVYSFVRAAADWRTAGGKWLVTNRWRCDPRWSFFGGESLRRAATIWHKVSLEGDVSVEFAGGIRHQGRKGGYKHASDMNVVICGDGKDLNSGYGFLFGGWGNTKTAITRNGKIVAELERTIPKSIHRRWFYFKVVKRGGHLRYYIDDKLVLEYEDPQPLGDGQVALWTYKNGLMVARVRIAADRIGPRERFDAPYPKISRGPYD